MYPFASLPENLAAFCDALRRQHGFHIGVGELGDAARALDVVDLADESAVRHALRPILAGTLDDVTAFDAAFSQFFLPGPAAAPSDQVPSTRREPGTGADGREAETAARARRSHRTPTRVKRSGRVAARSPRSSGRRSARRGRDGRSIELQSARG